MFAILIFALTLISGAPKYDHKFADRIAADLKLDRIVLHNFHNLDYEAEYTEGEAAYHRATDDLEEYTSGNRTISKERLRNDAWEVWMDLAPYRAMMRAGVQQ